LGPKFVKGSSEARALLLMRGACEAQRGVRLALALRLAWVAGHTPATHFASRVARALQRF